VGTLRRSHRLRRCRREQPGSGLSAVGGPRRRGHRDSRAGAAGGPAATMARPALTTAPSRPALASC